MFTNNTGILSQELSDVINTWVKSGDFETVQAPNAESNITFNLGSGGSEMLRITEDGFYVRGEKVPVDSKEAATVYRVFREWLMWAQLNRD